MKAERKDGYAKRPAIYPSFLKRLNSSVLQDIWLKADEVLRRADELVVIGYSLPESDGAIRALLNPVRKRLDRDEMKALMTTAAQRFTWVLGQGLRLAFRLRARYPRGRLRRRAGEPLILAPTHEHVLDPWLVLSALDYRTWRALTPVRILGTRNWTGWYRRLSWAIRGLYRLYGVVELPPRYRGATREEKLRGLFDALDRGEVVAIFPEGHVRRLGEPPVRSFEPGVVLLHRRFAAPVVPIAIRLGPRGRLRRRSFTVAVGKPTAIPEELDEDGSAEWLRERVRELHRTASGSI